MINWRNLNVGNWYRGTLLLIVFILQACTATKEVGIVAEALGDSTTPMSQRVATLKTQHTNLAASYNQLRQHVIASYDTLQLQLCNALVSESLASLYAAEAGLQEQLQIEFDKATDTIAPAITQGLSGLQAEIDRQMNQVEQQRQIGSARPLPGQYAEITTIALLQQRDELRINGVIASISDLQNVLSDIRNKIEQHVSEQVTNIDGVKNDCVENGSINEKLLPVIGNEANSPEEQYELAEAYMAHVSAVTKSLELYAETNSLLGENSLIRVLASAALAEFSGLAQAKQPSNSDSTPKASSLKDGLATLAKNLISPLKSEFKNFSIGDLLKDIGIGNIGETLGNKVKEESEAIANKVPKVIEKIKNDAKKKLASGG